MQQKIRVALNYVEITSSFEISFIHCASSLRDPAALPRAPFPLCFPFPRLYIFGDCVSSSAATSGIRKNDVPDDARLVFGTDPYCLVTPRSDFSWQSRKLRGSIWQKPRGFAYFIVALRILFQFSRFTS